ncbi:class I SAM-dependent methyltransferase [Corynebacterium sp. zg-331]|uniref:class I SAM-dependent methyltransferase n=1 Tax=unclassified Corynebacterium TaxID=2624378 RepID=UPI00128D1CEC|nr:MULTISPECIES: class I SAM-dependent methyltransferase [unclassified Corynebacterium]MBC3185586.1 class I SAM-dependent methyltransferase [Corynebacterium sp. zg-331]MPV52080.1 SAM-dependent methyltransferase [Corynebacterium sp. zg331]
MTDRHLIAIDVQAWPGLRAVPKDWRLRRRARRAEAEFAQSCAQAGLDLESERPDLVVEHDELFYRIASSGWLGLAESYMAGEWNAADLHGVLLALLGIGYKPARGEVPPRAYDGGALPSELVELSSSDGMSLMGGLFESGVPTTVRRSVPSFVSGAGHGGEPATHFVDITRLAPPVAVERADLGASQAGVVRALLDAAEVRRGSDVLEYPATGGAIALAAAGRGARPSAVTADAACAAAMEERLTLAGVTGMRPVAMTHPVAPGGVRPGAQAVVSVEYLELLDPGQRADFMASLDHSVRPGGYCAMQTLVATADFSAAAHRSLDVLRAYIWPGLQYPTAQEVHRLSDRASGLRVVGERHFAEHYALALKLQSECFEGHSREAAAAGFDQVFRRLWRYQFALRRALLDLGMIEAVQFTLTHRCRRGR